MTTSFHCDNDDHKHAALPIKVDLDKHLPLEQFAAVVVRQFKKIFDRSFVATLSQKDGKLIITAQQQDGGQDIMTVADVAAWLQTDRRTIRRMTEARARRVTPEHLRIPSFKFQGKLLRFWRSDLLAWRERVSKESHAYAPAKGKRKR
jgi:hypothetical protein